MIKCVYTKERFWKKCLQVARAQPELCAEEVEFRAVLIEIGLCPKVS